jgi:hypothetical protein
MLMLRKAIILGLVLVPGLIGTSVAVAAGGPYFASEPPAIPGAPYSAVATTQSTTEFSDGNRIVRTNTVRFFRDGQGRTRTERGVGGDGEEITAQLNPMIMIHDPVGGRSYVLNPQTKTAFVYKMPNRGAGAPPGGAGFPPAIALAPRDPIPGFALMGLGMGIGASASTEASSAETSLGQKVISGVSTTGTRIVRTIPSGVLGNEKPIISTLEEWRSPDLRVPVQISQKSSIGGVVTLNLSQVVRAEPDPTLFAPPADYTVHDVSMSMATGVTTSGSTVTAVKQP